MKELNELRPLTDFASLHYAKQFVHRIDTFKITEGVAKQYMLEPGNAVDSNYPCKWNHLRAIRADLTNPVSAFVDVILGRLETNGYFDVNPETDVGIANILLAHSLVGSVFADTADVEVFIGLSVINKYPYTHTTQEEYDEAHNPPADTGYTYLLPASTDSLTVRFNIAQSLDKTEKVKICQRYGSTGDLTPWHDLTHRQVRFHQDTYEVFIPSCQHEVRELKICSPVEITIKQDPTPESEVI